jgi:hypothetical protein
MLARKFTATRDRNRQRDRRHEQNFPASKKLKIKPVMSGAIVLYETGPSDLAGCCYFFLPDPNVGCQPAAVPFWLGAAAMILTLSFFGFLDSRLLLAMPSSSD